MNFPTIDIPSGRTKYEPEVHPGIGKGFLFVPTAGMRLAPQVLVLEMFREIFFPQFAGEAREKQLNPKLELESGEPAFTWEEKVVLYALRGRKKGTKASRGDDFYAPAYPCLAQHSWLRKRSDRVVRDFLFRGPLAQYFNGAGKDKSDELEQAVSIFFQALRGQMVATREEPHAKEMLSVPLRNEDFEINEEESQDRLRTEINDKKRVFRTPEKDDELAATIYSDFLSVCETEDKVPRMQWLSILMSFLRIALPTYLLSHMKLTVYLRDWALHALETGEAPSQQDITSSISTRNSGLFHPTSTPSREVFQHVEAYMKARVELSILLYMLEGLTGNSMRDIEIVTTNRGSGRVTIDELLTMFRGAQDAFRQNFGALTPAQIATRYAEQRLAWKNPLKKGQGKNYDEFLRVLYRAAEGDEWGSYILGKPQGRGRDRGFIVFPGPMLATTFVLLADRAKEKQEGRHHKGKLMLSDVEDHFRRYGIDFAAVAGARPRLIELLQEIGLLKGSPDAGESVEIMCPY